MRRRQQEANPDPLSDAANDAPAGSAFAAVLTTELARADRDVTGPSVLAPATPESVIELDYDRSPVRAEVTVDFWDRYDGARAMADLLDVPPATAVAVVGPLELAIPVVRRCIEEYPVGDWDVFVLTAIEDVPDEPEWTTLHRAHDLVSALEDPTNSAPILVLDVPRELPAAIRPLIERLRQGGLSMVRYVVDAPPDDEDLATWHGELGRPSVLDLAVPIEPARIAELLERGEPIASVDGVGVAAELILALQMELLR